MRGDYLILPDANRSQASGLSEKVNDPYTDIWVYKSGKRPKSISLEKMLYLYTGERSSCASSKAITLSRRLAPHH